MTIQRIMLSENHKGCLMYNTMYITFLKWKIIKMDKKLVFVRNYKWKKMITRLTMGIIW